MGTVGRGGGSWERGDEPRGDRCDDMEGLSLLLVEDDDLIRESLLDWMASVFFSSDLVGVPSDAVTSLSRSPAPEVIVVDVALSDSGGVEMVRSLHHVFPAAQIVALVVGSERQSCDAIRSAGARVCLPIWKVHEALMPIVRRLWRA